MRKELFFIVLLLSIPFSARATTTSCSEAKYVVKGGSASFHEWPTAPEVVVDGADLPTFRVIKGREKDRFRCADPALYAKDKNVVYYMGRKIEGADLASFVVIDGEAKDKANVYKRAERLEGVLPESFTPPPPGRKEPF